MDTLKPVVATDDVVTLLQHHFGPETAISGLTELSGGNVARTLAFAADDRDYIIRFNRGLNVNFAKEAFITELLAGTNIPIPAIVGRGQLGELDYAISVKMPGTRHDLIPPAESKGLMPALLDTLDAIHAVDVGATRGFGYLDNAGNGLSSSWHRSLAIVRDEEPHGGYYGRWHSLFETTFLERDRFDRLYARMTELLPLCPEERWLVHGNYGYGNVLIQGGTVTAVLDWLNARYGDFLFDIAWLNFWNPAAGWVDLAMQRYHARGLDIPHAAERLRCYEYAIALDAMRFYAKASDEAAYEWLCGRMALIERS